MSTPLEDLRLAMDVMLALQAEPGIPKGITPAVSRGVVTLEGEADSAEERQIAERAVRRLKQVKRVINAVTVR